MSSALSLADGESEVGDDDDDLAHLSASSASSASSSSLSVEALLSALGPMINNKKNSAMKQIQNLFDDDDVVMDR